MIKLLKKGIHKAGIDGAIAFTVLSRIIQAGGGILTLFFVAKTLNKVEQGYYYTFGSILAIQIFFELGLTNIITQFVAHERAFLNWESETVLKGKDESLSRLSSLLRFCVKWFGVLSIILIFGLFIAGFTFFNTYGEKDASVDWQIPWIILSLITAGGLMVSPILAFFEGLGKVKEVAKIRLVQQIVQLFLMYVFLLSGLKLYASPIAAFISIIIPPALIFFSSKRTLLKNLWNSLGEWKVNYRAEIFPYQWRIALSWISGYFIFQLFNPVVFATEGANVAGQMGMTLAVLNGVLSISLSWLNTKVPLFSTLIAQKKYDDLDTIFNKTVIHSSVVCLLCLLVFISGVYGLRCWGFAVGDRFLSLTLIVLLSGCIFVNQLVGALATYLRCHKEEPFLILSIVMGLLTACSTLILGNYFGIKGIVGGYSFLTIIVSLLWASYIFKTKKIQWHK